MEQGKGTISANDLMSKLVQAKKVMNKVDGGNYERGHVNQDVLYSDPAELMEGQGQPQTSMNPVGQGLNIDKINNSKLPDSIKRAMIERPIEQMPSISLNETLDMDFIKGAKKLMEQEGIQTKSTPQLRQQNYTSSNVDMNALATLVENTVRKVLDEKLNQILTAQQTQSINESLVLKVGDSVFKGKITGVNKAK